MLGWAVGFLVAAVVAAVGFGGVASAFTGLAVILFWVFLALFVLSLIFGRVRGGVGGGHARGFNFGGAGLVALVAIVAIAVYAWIDNGMSAERAGRAIDREAAQLADAASDTISEVGVRTESLVTRTQEQIRSNAANGLDQASRNVDPDDGAQN